MDGPVALPADGKGRLGHAHQSAEAQALLLHGLQHTQPRQHAAVTETEAAKKMMAAHLPAIRRPVAAHGCLDEAVPGLRQHHAHTPPGSHIQGMPQQPPFQDHRLAGHCASGDQQTKHIIAIYHDAMLIKEKAAIAITIEGQRQLPTIPTRRLGNAILLFLKHGIGYTHGQTRIGFITQADQCKGHPSAKLTYQRPSHAKAALGHHLHACKFLNIHLIQQIVHIGATHRASLQPATIAGRRTILPDRLAQRTEAAMAIQGHGGGTNDLEPIVRQRIVTGGHHDATSQTLLQDGIVHLFCGSKPKIKAITTLGTDAAGQGPSQRLAGRSHVPAQGIPACAQATHQGTPDTVSQGLVQFIGYQAPNIICPQGAMTARSSKTHITTPGKGHSTTSPAWQARSMRCP